MDLKTGESRVLTEAKDLVVDSITLTPDERHLLSRRPFPVSCESGERPRKRSVPGRG